MITTKVTATVPKCHNSIWAGRGNVVSINVESGDVILYMTTGVCKGIKGEFDIDKVRFHVTRTS